MRGGISIPYYMGVPIKRRACLYAHPVDRLLPEWLICWWSPLMLPSETSSARTGDGRLVSVYRGKGSALPVLMIKLPACVSGYLLSEKDFSSRGAIAPRRSRCAFCRHLGSRMASPRRTVAPKSTFQAVFPARLAGDDEQLLPAPAAPKPARFRRNGSDAPGFRMSLRGPSISSALTLDLPPRPPDHLQ